jgi:hypothetical protein
MADDKPKQISTPDDVRWPFLENMHKTLLEALRHREQEILRYIAILAPALGGFVWLVRDVVNGGRFFVFTIGTLGVLFLLVIGALYSLGLGYNYRYITMQLAKIEALSPGILKFILAPWARTPQSFEKYNPCYPPEIIKIFWLAFVVCMGGVTGIVLLLPPIKENWLMKGIILVFGIICFYVSVMAPTWYGRKLEKACKEEEKEGTW